MTTISITDFRKDPDTILQRFADSGEPIRITRKGKKPLIIMPEEDYESWQETFYLLRSPENARRLREAVTDFNKGKQNYQAHDLL